MRLNKTIVALVAASLAVPCAFAASGVKSAGNAGKSSCVASTADPLMKVVVGNSYKSKKQPQVVIKCQCMVKQQ